MIPKMKIVQFFFASDNFHIWIGWHYIPFSVIANDLRSRKSFANVPGMRDPTLSHEADLAFVLTAFIGRLRVSPSRVSNFKDPQRIERAELAIVFGNRAGPAEKEKGRVRLTGGGFYCIIMDITHTNVCLNSSYLVPIAQFMVVR